MSTATCTAGLTNVARELSWKGLALIRKGRLTHDITDSSSTICPARLGLAAPFD